MAAKIGQGGRNSRAIQKLIGTLDLLYGGGNCSLFDAGEIV